MPEDSVREELKNIIHSFSNNFGGPKFEPHVTLVSSFLGHEKGLLQKTEMISKKIKPFKIFFDGILHLDEYFRTLFLKVKFSSQLQEARDITGNELNWNDQDYTPHLSLTYGKYGVREKEKMISTLDSLPDCFFVNKIFLAQNDEIRLKWNVIRGFKLGE